MSAVSITPYLFYAGRCEEAIQFYSLALGAKMEMAMKFSESPHVPPPGMLQPGFEDKIMHATVAINNIRVMMSDGCDDKSRFDGFRLALAYAEEAEAQKAFQALAEGGKIDMPMTKTFFAPCYGMVTDKFNVGWMVMVPGPM